MPLSLRLLLGSTVAVLSIALASPMHAQSSPQPTQPAIDHDLLEITIPQLQHLYATHTYTVTQVVNWYINRIHKYNPIYGAIENLDAKGALATAAREDAEARAEKRG